MIYLNKTNNKNELWLFNWQERKLMHSGHIQGAFDNTYIDWQTPKKFSKWTA